ncbi:hypothetical protein ASF56_24750 [Methylobacterium sp. Leaf122]|nr:hypothetical protein [Methylobacterium sp. Leaf122]KQQ11533.1 hypothetical protein ASF56_24750 [Methylobacterium sp. Leaf122]
MTNQIENDITAAKAAARAELEAFRERRRLEREAREAAAVTADEEIAALVRARRAEEESRAQINAIRQRHMAEREAMIEAERQAERERKLVADPRRRIAEHPARRVALKIREHIQNDVEFGALLADVRSVNWNQLKIELARIPQDEQAAALHRRREELAAKLAAETATLPVPENEEEAAILRNFGFVAPSVAACQLEISQGAL